MLEKGKTTPKIAHNYKDGKGTVCGATDPNYKPDTNSPQTGENSNILLWAALLFLSGGALSGTLIFTKKRFTKR